MSTSCNNTPRANDHSQPLHSMSTNPRAHLSIATSRSNTSTNSQTPRQKATRVSNNLNFSTQQQITPSQLKRIVWNAVDTFNKTNSRQRERWFRPWHSQSCHQQLHDFMSEVRQSTTSWTANSCPKAISSGNLVQQLNNWFWTVHANFRSLRSSLKRRRDAAAEDATTNDSRRSNSRHRSISSDNRVHQDKLILNRSRRFSFTKQFVDATKSGGTSTAANRNFGSGFTVNNLQQDLKNFITSSLHLSLLVIKISAPSGVGPSVRPSHFFLRSLVSLLPKWSSDLKYGPCPHARDWDSRIFGLVFWILIFRWSDQKRRIVPDFMSKMCKICCVREQNVFVTFFSKIVVTFFYPNFECLYLMNGSTDWLDFLYGKISWSCLLICEVSRNFR